MVTSWPWVHPPSLVERVEDVVVWLESFNSADPVYLDLSREYWQARGMKIEIVALLENPVIARLRGLSTRDLFSGPDTAMALAASPYLSQLAILDVEGNNLESVGAAALARSPYLGGLTDLNIAYNNIGVHGLKALLDASFIPNLGRLNVRGNALQDEGLALLARSEGLSGLTALIAGKNSINEVLSSKLLFSSPTLQHLTTLELSGADFGIDGIEGAADLAHAPFFCNLEELYLNECGLSDGAAVYLFGFAALPRLRVLDLTVNVIRPDGAFALAGCHLPALVALHLHMNFIGDDGTAALALSGNMPALQMLDLSENDITDAGADVFVRNHSLPALRQLNLARNGISVEVLQAIQRVGAGLQIAV